MARKRSIDFLTVTLFVGVLLTFLIYVGVGMIMNGGDTTFNSQFQSEESLTEGIKQINYRIFRSVNDDNIIVGKDGWVFEVKDSETGYERLLDYIGGYNLTEDELRSIADGISGKKETYAQMGVDYMLLVVPDSATVCSQKMPWYLGKQSENTRLSQLSSYMKQNNKGGLLEPSEIMKNDSREMLMYNNTENSINAYGAYCIYNAVVAQYLRDDTGIDVDRVLPEEIKFYTRVTDGRDIAQSVGLSNVLKNNTVSLSDNSPSDYEIIYNEKGLVMTERISNSMSQRLSVTVECADSWNRAQLMPYFSSTFDSVYYKDKLSDTADIVNTHGSKLIIQIINEGELQNLIK